MLVRRNEIQETAGKVPSIGRTAAESCAWLQACGYPGIRILLEAMDDAQKELVLAPDAMGLDLHNVSCVFIGPAVLQETQKKGRCFLRNVRHGLYLVPLSVTHAMAIGCPIDPNFGLGGERVKNPYIEMLETADRDGIEVEDEVWALLLKAGATQ